jgi:hypothetical protein
VGYTNGKALVAGYVRFGDIACGNSSLEDRIDELGLPKDTPTGVARRAASGASGAAGGASRLLRARREREGRERRRSFFCVSSCSLPSEHRPARATTSPRFLWRASTADALAHLGALSGLGAGERRLGGGVTRAAPPPL